MKTRLFAALAGLMFAGAAFAANPMVEMKTSLGDVVFELYPDKAPKTVDNFLKYVNGGFYKGVVFHRSVKDFVVQAGLFGHGLEPKEATLPPIPNEANSALPNLSGTLAMARSRDPNSATSQFFVNLADNKILNHFGDDPDHIGYCVFGRVVSGMAVLRKLNEIPTETRKHADVQPKGKLDDVPVQEVAINDMLVVDKLPAGMIADADAPPAPKAAPAPAKSKKKATKKKARLAKG